MRPFDAMMANPSAKRHPGMGALYFFLRDRIENRHDTGPVFRDADIAMIPPSRPASPVSPEGPAIASHDREVARQSIERAEQLLISALERQSAAERRNASTLGRMMDDPSGKNFTLAMVDQVFRSRKASGSARRWRRLLGSLGVPRFLPYSDRILMRLGAFGSRIAPGIVMKAIASRLRADSARVILPGEEKSLHRHLSRRAAEGFRINLNQLGEAVLGEEEAGHRLEKVLAHLDDPAVNYVSVKISAIHSQISLVAWDASLREIQTRLRELYRAAMRRKKFVNLDMEEYRDLELTLAAFRGVLDEPEFLRFSAGIVLQAYLPDSWNALRELTEWAKHRVAAGGAPIKVRLVKGANLAMERVEAEIHGWHPAPYASKAETDANFRRLLEFGCEPENAAAVRLGVGSHNLFDVALALTLRERNQTASLVEIEMLEGMANHQARAVRDAAGGLLLYAPVVRREDFLSAMAYLVRRLDENSAPENFLHDLFAMRPGSESWERQKVRFQQGWIERHTLSSEPRRRRPAIDPSARTEFANEPDSDWTQPGTRAAFHLAAEPWRDETPPPLPLLETILNTARSAQQDWERLGVAGRAKILDRAAGLMSAQRFTTLACLRLEGKKAVLEADAEVSEAIDFARYYARTAGAPAGIDARARGIVAVVSPWNFPYAIPAGGLLAALVGGNAVVFKPARCTSRIAWHLVRQLWAAGVPREVLHFFPCDNEMGKNLLTDPRLGGAILTGSLGTARLFQSWRPDLPLFAETSGKNALIVTAQSDRDLAIRDLARSAFGHSGQKCSAASLGILEAEVYDDPAFRRQLRDAVASLPAGPATDPRSVVTPLVNEPGPDLHRALTTLDEGEEWLLQPRIVGDDPCAWTPGIRLGVKPGSWFHRTECFGPVLGLMRADSLAQATAWQNATDFGLTAGLHSLDPDEIAWWREHAEAGNLYINRPITGAIVQRQPFGGWKKSCIGPGAKAGGPNYVLGLCHLADADDATMPDYAEAWASHFALEHDPSALRAESNVFRYRPCRGVILRLERRDEVAISRARLAAAVTGVPLTLSLAEEESDEEFIARLAELAVSAEFLRTTRPPDPKILRAAHEAGLNWIDGPLLASGRAELSRWLREQSISETRHRYGLLPPVAESPPTSGGSATG